MRVLGKVVAAVVLIPILVLVAGIGGCEARKAYYDWQVQKMCEQDGGVTVFERVALSHDEYIRFGGSDGQVPLPEERNAPANYPYVSKTTRTTVKEGSPQITRTEALITRRLDGKALGRFVTYTRTGGDFPSWAHHSYKMCELPRGNVSQQIFTVEERAR